MSNFTIIVPTRNNELLANGFLECVLRTSNFEIIVIDDFSDIDLKYVVDDRITIIKNKHKQSLTKLWNQGIRLCKTDNVIICSHKVRPSENDFNKILELTYSGFGLVAISGFHFFSFNKFLCGKIGTFDEGFTGGWYEDNDFLNKMVVNNISYYLSEEVHDLKGASGWEHLHLENRNYYFSKWIENGDEIIQVKDDLNQNDKFLFKDLNYTIEYSDNSKSVHNINSYRKYNRSKKLF